MLNVVEAKGLLVRFRVHLIILILVFGSVIGVFNLLKFDFNFILDVVIVSFSVFFTSKISKSIFYFSIFFTLYFLISFFYAIFYSSVSVLDFLLSYKSIFYLIVLVVYSRSEFLSKLFYNRLVSFFCFFFLLGYLYDFLMFGNRKFVAIFFESNYEILFLSIVFYFKYIINGRVAIFDFLFYTLCVLISLSFSGLFIYIFILFAISSRLLKRRIFVLVPFVAFVCFGVYFFWQLRFSSFDLSEIDRVVFFKAFLFETSNWNFLDYLFGTPRITALSRDTCLSLNYYDSLFSFSSDIVCYSVILHSYLLRVVFDHGLVVLIAIFVFLYKLFRYNRINVFDSCFFLLLFFLNSISVSSLNSVYSVLAVIIVFSVKKSD